MPDGAEVIPQTRGTAPGLICPVTTLGPALVGPGKVAYLVPGVPHEMKDMLERAILPDLRRRSGDPSVIVSRTLRTWAEIRGEVGIQVFGVDDDTMESVVLQLLRERGLTLGLAESVTGGLVSGRLTAIPGASDVLRGSIVSYASEVKFDLLGVTPGPVVNEDTALVMAEGARRVLRADVGIGLTGVAGPGEQDGMPVGTLCVGLVIGDSVSGAPLRRHVTTLRLPGQRQQMREFSVISALDLLRRTLLAG